MPRKGFSVVIVPDDTGKVIEKRIGRWKIITVLAVLSVFFICSMFFALSYFKTNIDRQKLTSLEKENVYLASKIKNLRESVETIKERIADIVDTDEKIRLVFDLPIIDPSIREVGIGGPDFNSLEFSSLPIKKLSLVEKDINKILRQIDLENASLNDVYDKILNRKNVLDHTPSIMPAEGFITSGVGMRKDPFTGLVVMHKGIDIAADKGTSVVASANGIIERCGWERGMGNYIIVNHGNNIKTYYGHLSLIKVKKGQNVKRMDVIGLVGSTGRSTGPHLHYEVRKYGRYVNPRDYFIKSIIFRS